jgi:hypothetical protein
VISVRLAFCRSEIVVLVIFHGAGLADNYSEDQDNFPAVIRSNPRPRAVREQLRKIGFFVLLSCLNSAVLPPLSADFAYENGRKERVRGIEPPCAAWEAAVLPLNYTRVLEK